jgi:hypothetical protein
MHASTYNGFSIDVYVNVNYPIMYENRPSLRTL